MADIVPYAFQGKLQVPAELARLPGKIQGVYFTLTLDAHAALLTKIIGWFEGREEVVLVDYGTTDKPEGFGYIILEWDECEVDSLFVAILRDEELVEHYTVYTREVQ